jgi:hypothetical protein
MAEETRKINIVELDIEQDVALSDLTELQQKIEETKDSTTTLTKANKDLAATGKNNTAQYQKNAKQIELNKTNIKGLNKEYSTQQKVVNDVMQVKKKELGTLEKLTLSNKELREELRGLDLETKKGQERRKEINKQIDENTDVIQENSDSMVQQKMNIGNYQSALGGMGPGLSSAAGGFQKMTMAAKAFIATPIGMILAAIAVVLKLVSEGFKRSQGLMDKFASIMKGIGAAFDVVFDRISNALERMVEAFKNPKEAIKDLYETIKTNLVNRVKALPDFFVAIFTAVKNAIKGNMDEAKIALKEAGTAFIQFQTGMDAVQQKKFADGVRGITKEIREETVAAANLEMALRKLQDREIEYIVTKAKGRKEIAAARLLAEDDTVAIKDRMVALDNAIKIEKDILAEEMAIAKERARIAQQQVDLGKSVREDYEELAQAKAVVFELEEQSLKTQKRLFTERVRLVDEQAVIDKAAAAETAARIQKEAADLQKFVDNEIKIWMLRNETAIQKGEQLTDSLIAEEKDRLNELEEQRVAATDLSFENELITQQEHELALLQIQKEAVDAKLAIDQQYAKERTKIEAAAAKLRIAIAKEEEKLKYEVAHLFFSAIADVASENTIAHKGATTALMAIDTYKGALAAFASFQVLPPPMGPILGGIAAGAVTAMGLKSIAKVWAVNPKGAQSVSGPSTGRGGGQVAAQAIPEAQISSSGGLVERRLNVSGQETTEIQVPVNNLDQITIDQQNLKTIEALSSV